MGSISTILTLPLVLVPAWLFASGVADVPGTANAELAQLETRIALVADELRAGIDQISFGATLAYRLRAKEIEPDLYRMMDILDQPPEPFDGDARKRDALASIALLVARILAQERPTDAVRLMKRVRQHLERVAFDELSDEEAEMARSEILASIDVVTAIYLAASGDREDAMRLAERAWAEAPRFADENAAEGVSALGLDRLQVMLGDDPQRLVSEELDRAAFDRPWTINSRERPGRGAAFDFTLLMPQPADVLRRLGQVEALAQVLLAKHWQRMSFGCEPLDPVDPVAFETTLDGAEPGSLRTEWRVAVEALGEASTPPFAVHLKGLTLALPVGIYDHTGRRRALDDGSELAGLLACGPLGRFLDPNRPCALAPHCELSALDLR